MKKSLAELEANFIGNLSASRMKGTNVTIENNGVAELSIKNVNAAIADVEASGVGSVTVWVDSKSTVDRSGIGKVNILGQKK